MKKNPLLKFSQYPDFKAIRPEHIVPALTQLIAEHRDGTQKILREAKNHPTWENLIYPFEEIDDHLDSAFRQVAHLNSVMHSDELQAEYSKALAMMTAYGVVQGQNKRLYNLVQKLVASDEYVKLDAAQHKILSDMLRDFELSGVGLVGKKKQEFRKVSKRLSSLNNKFAINVLKSKQSWSYPVTSENELSGLSEQVKQMLQLAAKERKLDGWLLTLDEPIYIAVLTYCDSAKLRQKMYKARNTVASKYADNKRFNNDKIILEILKLRLKLAKILGYENYAEVSLATKMAQKPQIVTKFLNKIISPAKKAARREYADIKRFVKAEYGVTKINPWDFAYYSEKLRQSKYAIDSQKLREYFPEPQVIQGLFAIANKLYGITLREVKGKSVWNKDVRFYAVFNANDKQIGGIYFDLYARSNKRGGAWMDECRIRRILPNGEVQLPIAHLVCNLTKSAKANEPALFGHQEVWTLFHEFGHVMQHVLTKVDYADASGIQGVAWDAVEFPSQFMEHWFVQKKSLPLISKHYKSGKCLPKVELNNLVKAKNFNSGLQCVRQLEFALFDMLLHVNFEPRKGLMQVGKTLEAVRKKVAVIDKPKYVKFENSFLHIFSSGEYAAGYYSYKWAEVLACDAFSKFLEQGIFNRKLGKKFWDCVLAVGGSVEPMQAFADFMGRKPEVGAMLELQGLLNNN